MCLWSGTTCLFFFFLQEIVDRPMRLSVEPLRVQKSCMAEKIDGDGPRE